MWVTKPASICVTTCRHRRFEADASTPGRKFLIIFLSTSNIASDLRKINQFATRAFDRTCTQNSSLERPMDGLRSYSAQRRSNSRRCATGDGKASGLRIDATSSSANSNRSKSLS